MSSNIKIKKICLHCRQEFIARTTVTKYCNLKCAQRAYKANARELKIQQSNSDQQTTAKETKSEQNLASYFELKTLDYLTVQQAAVLLNCDRRTIYRLVKSGRIPSANLSSRRIRILKRDIDLLFVVPEKVEDTIPATGVEIENTPLKNCFTIGQILNDYKLSETSLRSLIIRHNIPKFQKGKFVYIPKNLIEPILNKILLNEYCG